MRTLVSFLSAVGYGVGALSAFCTLSPLAAAQSKDAFKRLNAAEIRSSIVGKVVTDESHWADGFESNGKLEAMELGQRKSGTWKLQGNELCVTRKARKPVEECFEIWQSRDQIEYRRDGITLTSGRLRKE